MIWNILYDILVSLEDFIKSVRCAHSIKWYLARLGLRIADRTLDERFTYHLLGGRSDNQSLLSIRQNRQERLSTLVGCSNEYGISRANFIITFCSYSGAQVWGRGGAYSMYGTVHCFVDTHFHHDLTSTQQPVKHILVNVLRSTTFNTALLSS